MISIIAASDQVMCEAGSCIPSMWRTRRKLTSKLSQVLLLRGDEKFCLKSVRDTLWLDFSHHIGRTIFPVLSDLVSANDARATVQSHRYRHTSSRAPSDHALHTRAFWVFQLRSRSTKIRRSNSWGRSCAKDVVMLGASTQRGWLAMQIVFPLRFVSDTTRRRMIRVRCSHKQHSHPVSGRFLWTTRGCSM